MHFHLLGKKLQNTTVQKVPKADFSSFLSLSTSHNFEQTFTYPLGYHSQLCVIMVTSHDAWLDDMAYLIAAIAITLSVLDSLS